LDLHLNPTQLLYLLLIAASTCAPALSSTCCRLAAVSSVRLAAAGHTGESGKEDSLGRRTIKKSVEYEMLNILFSDVESYLLKC
jgi:hypothetical protein